MGVLGSNVHPLLAAAESELEVMSISYESLLSGFEDRGSIGTI